MSEASAEFDAADGRPPLARFLVVGALLLILLAPIAWQIVVRGLAAELNERPDIARAVALAPRSPLAASVAAEGVLAAGNAARADALARSAVLRSPLDVRALRVRAIANDAAGGADAGVAQLDLAARLGWRDTPTQVLLIDLALRNGLPDVAVQRIDAVMRRWVLHNQMVPMMRAATTDPAFVAAVATRVADDPPWRQLFMENLAGLSDAQVDGQVALLRAMKTAETPVRRAELANLLDLLIARGDYRPAFALWREIGDDIGDRRANMVGDADFTAVSRRSGDDVATIPFDWALNSAVGFNARIDLPSFAPTDPALAIDTDGASTGWAARQTLLLAPGAYRLSMDRATEASVPDDRFRWRVLCLPESKPLETSKPVVTARARWSRVEMRFAVPAGGCTAQQLMLMVDRPTIPQPATAWFDRIRIARP